MPASAVGNTGLTSRFFKGKKRDAMDEIEGWISDAKSEFGRGNSSRVSAQPPKNITEQKMLDAKLFEMSKQRYNFILHSKWQQKVFMEKQKQKTSVMKDLLKNVDLGRVQRSGNQRNRLAKRTSFFNEQFGYASTFTQSEASKTVDNATIAPSETEVSESDNHQKKTVTFVTERTNRNEILPHILDNSKVVIDAVQSANIQDYANLSNAKHRNVTELPEITNRRRYIILHKDERWPVKDLRFVKLSAALSSNISIKRRRGLTKA
ncbi:uncharacterized protein LOC120340885 [Styela clava]|uniref:uncharacterized protein LOC120340885 n=1 Tax=Styela clava TaxID=7725 RepID=UPI00193AC719|nr:uncharacterized protein LOC120340885 [Styela clava]